MKPQKPKPRKVANPALSEAMQQKRYGNAAVPHRSKKAYVRKPKYGSWE